MPDEEQVNNPVGQCVGVNPDGTLSVLFYDDSRQEAVDQQLSESDPYRHLPRRKIKIVSDGTMQRTYVMVVDDEGRELGVIDYVTKCDIEIGAEDDRIKAHLEITLPQLDITAEEGVRVVRQD